MSNESKTKEFFITTSDNPYDYFKQFDEWLHYDRLMGYYTLELLARVVKTSNELSDEEQQNDLEEAIDTIIEWHGSFYKKIFKD